MKKGEILTVFENYDYECVFEKQINEKLTMTEADFLGRKIKRKNYCIVVKTIKSGNMVESEVYPAYFNECSAPRGEKKKASKTSQRNLNDRNAKKHLVRLINANFTKHGKHVTLTYSGKEPLKDEAEKDVKNYLRRINYALKKAGKRGAKYIAVTEYKNGDGKKAKIHHHIVLECALSRDEIENIWKKGRANADRLRPDDFGLEGLARYITKNTGNGKRYTASRNLKQPVITKSYTRLTKRKVYDIALDFEKAREIFENTYKNCVFLDFKARYTDDFDGVYLYARLRHQKIEPLMPKRKSGDEK